MSLKIVYNWPWRIDVKWLVFEDKPNEHRFFINAYKIKCLIKIGNHKTSMLENIW